MNNTLLEWLGYLASLIVLISLLMSSILKLRWINLLGSGIFAVYGFLIRALPVGFMNTGIAVINIYYLIKIYGSKEYFKMISFESRTSYLNYFLTFYQNNIKSYMPDFDLSINAFDVSFYVLRNTVPAGIFIGSRYSEDTLKVELDFVVPEYRDFKIGSYIYQTNKTYFLKKGYSKLVCFSSNKRHIKYLQKMGFKKTFQAGKCFYLKALV